MGLFASRNKSEVRTKRADHTIGSTSGDVGPGKYTIPSIFNSEVSGSQPCSQPCSQLCSQPRSQPCSQPCRLDQVRSGSQNVQNFKSNFIIEDHYCISTFWLRRRSRTRKLSRRVSAGPQSLAGRCAAAVKKPTIRQKTSVFSASSPVGR